MKTKSPDAVIRQFEDYVLPTYTRYPIVFESGSGSSLWDSKGRKYLDFFPGWGVSNLGHCHPRVVKAIQKQAGQLMHLANVFHIPPQGELAQAIVERAFPGKVFFCNSGTESVECALKAAKTHGRSTGKTEIIAFKKSFHGRTTGALALTGQNAYQKPFRPLLPHIRHADFNECEGVRSLITEKTAAVIIEPVQGEGGVNVASKKFLKSLRQWTRKQGALLILDEVQTGFGRTGKWFAYQHYGIQPDILCMAKAIAGGCPMGAVLIGDRHTGLLPAGTHASTFGGNYLASRAALAILEVFDKEKVFERMIPLQETLTSFFQDLKKQVPQITDFRHLGMMYGLEFSGDLASRIALLALERGLIINCTAGKVLRIMPALNLSLKDCRQGLKILKECVTDECQ